MKKVLFMLPSMELGGTEKSLLNLLDTLSENKYEITILLMQKKGRLLNQIPSWVTVREVPNYYEINYDFSMSPFILTLKYLSKLRLLRAANILGRHLWYRLTHNRNPYYNYVYRRHRLSGEYDTAIAYLGPYDQLSSYVLNCIDAKEKIQWIHFDVSKYLFYRETCRKMYPLFDRINVVSNEAKDALIGIIPEISSKTFVVPNVISEKKCKEMAESESGFTDNYIGTRIITVGRLSEEKGQDIIPETAYYLKKKGIIFKWYIIGEGTLETIIKEEIKEYKVDDHVLLLGAKENPYPFFKQADIYVQTSKHEGYGITLAEAKIFNLAIISTPCSGVAEQLERYANSRVVKRDPQVIAESIMLLLGYNKQKERMGLN